MHKMSTLCAGNREKRANHHMCTAVIQNNSCTYSK